MKNHSRSIFWASYADLMTALFIITLVLFVLSYKMFKDKEAGLLALEDELSARSLTISKQEEEMETLRGYILSERALADTLVKQLDNERGKLLVMEQEYRKLREIEEALAKLNPELFQYQPEYRRHVLRTQVQFEKGSAVIGTQFHGSLRQAGSELKRLVDSLREKNIKYLLVIEGSASRDNYTRNYELSYERALGLYRLWESQGIKFDPDVFEVIISGSGTGGVGRVQGNERLNQRFLIQVLPKVGTIEMVDWDRLDSISRELETDKVLP